MRKFKYMHNKGRMKLTVQGIHVALSEENFDASWWTAVAFSDDCSVVGSHVSNDLVDHFNLEELGKNVSKRNELLEISFC